MAKHRKTAIEPVAYLRTSSANAVHFGEIEARSADLSKVDKTRAEWA
jgi:hypothetical protein